jgi:hypothetical protein
MRRGWSLYIHSLCHERILYCMYKYLFYFPQRDVILNRSLLYHTSFHLDLQTRSKTNTKKVTRTCAVGRDVFTQQIITLVGFDIIICPAENWTGFDTYSQHHVFCPFNTNFLFRCMQLSELCCPLYTLQHIAYLLHNLCIPTTALYT